MSSIEIDVQKRIINLPKVPLHDFAVRRISNTTAVDCLRCLLPYLRKEDKVSALKMLSDANVPVIRFKAPSLKCRPFQILNSRNPSSAVKNNVPVPVVEKVVVASTSSNVVVDNENSPSSTD